LIEFFETGAALNLPKNLHSVSSRGKVKIQHLKEGKMISSLPVKVFATRGSDILAQEVCEALRGRLPLDPQSRGSLTLAKHAVFEMDNENILVQLKESVRGHFVVIIDTHASPVHTRFFELLHLTDAVINAGSEKILSVFPYFEYSRSDRKDKPRISTLSVPLAGIWNEVFKIERKLLLDPHSQQIKHYFQPAADEISAMYLWVDYLERKLFVPNPGLKEKSIIVFADAGSFTRYGEILHVLNLPSIHLDKERYEGEARTHPVTGYVKDKNCLILDDEICSGGTVESGARNLLDKGAKSVMVLAIHGILSSKKMSRADLIKKLDGSETIDKFIITNSVHLPEELKDAKKFVVLSVAPLLAEAISRIVLNFSLTELHQPEKVALYR
jgi:ribose-phosphate pyrophosphokinase